MSESDDRLKQRLEAGDPATADRLPPPPRALPEIVDSIVAEPRDGVIDIADARRRQRFLRIGLVAAALVVLIGGGYYLAYVQFTGGTSSPTRPSVVALRLPDTGSPSCAAPTPHDLARVPVAFAATVRSARAGVVRLRVDHWYRGGDADQVIMRTARPRPGPSGAGVSTGGSAIPDVRVGTRYLIAARKGVVQTCLTTFWSRHFAHIYATAFRR